MSKPFYITTTLPYVNAEPHIGFAMEIIRADVIARSKIIEGYDVFMNTGTDEHGTKIWRRAKDECQDPKEYVDALANRYKELMPALGLAVSVPNITFNFVRTTDEHHRNSAQEFWRRVEKNGYIYKKNYSIKYCVGCELEKTESELENGRCPLHPLQELEILEEENYFFKFSAFGEKLLALYESRPDFVIPSFRFNEIKEFVKRGLEDFSISRLASKMPWGVTVPGDPDQVMYVWFDALANYVTAVGWPDDEVQGKNVPGSFEKWWEKSGGVVQYCGKDNLRQQSAMWQAMLMAAGLPPSRSIVINGFITGEGGIKMSKSLGNTVNPFDIVNEYGTDALRYFVLRELHPFEDSPFTPEKFKEAYNANLANGIGNLTSRIMKMSEEHLKIGETGKSDKAGKAGKNEISPKTVPWPKEFCDALDKYDIKRAADVIWKKIGELDELIQKEQPFKMVKSEDTKPGAVKIIGVLVEGLSEIAVMLLPILPETAGKIIDCIEKNKMPVAPIFMRK